MTSHRTRTLLEVFNSTRLGSYFFSTFSVSNIFAQRLSVSRGFSQPICLLKFNQKICRICNFLTRYNFGRKVIRVNVSTAMLWKCLNVWTSRSLLQTRRLVVCCPAFLLLVMTPLRETRPQTLSTPRTGSRPSTMLRLSVRSTVLKYSCAPLTDISRSRNPVPVRFDGFRCNTENMLQSIYRDHK